ncbi:hypothetical protein RJ639_029666 [Escallonia herrerae]|uniref:Uncharacterized protein n=1 Tax=Escallonia herrerae TaxID=1293975 RepID=A0AA88X1J9_9ASTE|nr:hypothetical protein RJ639_029666 [Escallonia herrerae]
MAQMVCTSELFKIEFNKNIITRSVKLKKFLNLERVNLMVQQYATKFTSLARHDSYLVEGEDRALLIEKSDGDIQRKWARLGRTRPNLSNWQGGRNLNTNASIGTLPDLVSAAHRERRAAFKPARQDRATGGEGVGSEAEREGRVGDVEGEEGLDGPVGVGEGKSKTQYKRHSSTVEFYVYDSANEKKVATGYSLSSFALILSFLPLLPCANPFGPSNLQHGIETTYCQHRSILLPQCQVQRQRAWELLGNIQSRGVYDTKLRALRQDAIGAKDVTFEDLTVEDAGPDMAPTFDTSGRSRIV